MKRYLAILPLALALGALGATVQSPEPAHAQTSGPGCRGLMATELQPAWGALVNAVPDAERIIQATCPMVVVGDLDEGTYGSYRARTNTVTISRTLLDADPRVQAVTMAHELRHAEQQLFVKPGDNGAACFEREADAFAYEAQAVTKLGLDRLTLVAAQKLGGDISGLRSLAALYKRSGKTGIARMVGSSPGYNQQCEAFA